MLLLDPEQLTDARTAVAARRTHVGLRGCRWAGVEFDDCPVPESALLGPEGSGIETALRSFQISRTVISATAVAALDTSLRTAVRFDRENSGGWQGRGIDGRTGAALTNAFVNLLLYDSLAVVATRALHLLPAETSVYSAALKYLLPRVLTETMYDLSIVLGSGFYTREGTLGIFQKHVRDVPVLSLGHAGTVACQATVIPQMPRLARSSWFIEDEAPAGLFRLRGDLPPLRTDRLSLACGRDSLTASMLVVAAGVEGSGPVERALRTLAGQLVEELRDVRRMGAAAGGRRVRVHGAARAVRPHGPLRAAPGGGRRTRAVGPGPLRTRPVPRRPVLGRRRAAPHRPAAGDPGRGLAAGVRDADPARGPAPVQHPDQLRPLLHPDPRLTPPGRPRRPHAPYASKETTMTVPSALTGTHPTTTGGGVLPHEWLMDRLSLYLRRAPESIDPGVPLAEYGMDSVAALSLCGDLEDEFGLEVEPTLLWDHPTVTALVRHLEQVLPVPAPATEDAPSATLAPARDQR